MNIDELKKEALEKAGAYEVLTNNAGFSYIKKHVEDQITNFINRSLLDGFKTIEDYQYARGYCNGLRELLDEVKSSIDELTRYREATRSKDGDNQDKSL